MKQTKTLGAILIGLGVGLLINSWFPGLRWLWPFGLIVGGILLWRDLGPYGLRVGLTAAALAIPLLGGVTWPSLESGNRELARYESSDEDEAAWEGLERLLIVNTSGDIEVERGNDLEVEVSYHSYRRNAYTPERLLSDYNNNTNTLRIFGIDPTLSEREKRGLRSDIRIYVPERILVEVVNDTGDIEVSGVSEVKLETGTGNIEVQNIANKTAIQTDTGSISIENARGPIAARSDTGSITIELEDEILHDLSASTDTGKISLSLPKESDVTVNATSETHQFSDNFENITASEGKLRLGSGEHTVTLSTDTGSIVVKER
ncbi:MAG: DUF4097 family beta strand repeat-containing protein [Trueperaceae bacterium]